MSSSGAIAGPIGLMKRPSRRSTPPRKEPAVTRTLYELVGAEDRRFSPYCWRIRMALAHKCLNAEFETCRFTTKNKIAFSGHKLVPVMVDGERVVNDSWGVEIGRGWCTRRGCL